MPIIGVDPNETIELPIEYGGEVAIFTFKRMNYTKWLSFRAKMKITMDQNSRTMATDDSAARRQIFIDHVVRVSGFEMPGHEGENWETKDMPTVFDYLPPAVGSDVTNAIIEQSELSESARKNS